MKWFAVLLLIVAIFVELWQRGVFSPPPPPPPPPPAILQEPALVINDAEMQRVLQSVRDPEASVRLEAIMFLDKVKSPKALPLMLNMIQHDLDPALRVKVIELLGNHQGPDAVAALIAALQELDPDIRIAALKALEKIGDFSAASAIADGPIHDREEQVRLQAMRTLSSLQDKRQKEIDEARLRYEAEKAAAAQNQNK